MKLKLIKQNSQELKLDIKGEGHTFWNLLESILLEDETIDFASYDVPHPLVSSTTVLIRTKKGRKPEDALNESIEKTIQKGREFKEAFNEALSESQE